MLEKRAIIQKQLDEEQANNVVKYQTDKGEVERGRKPNMEAVTTYQNLLNGDRQIAEQQEHRLMGDKQIALGEEEQAKQILDFTKKDMDSKISAAKAVADAQKKADEQLALHGTYTQAPDATARTQEEIENKSYIATRKGLEDKLHLQEQYQRQNIAGATEAIRDLNAQITALDIEHQTMFKKSTRKVLLVISLAESTKLKPKEKPMKLA